MSGRTCVVSWRGPPPPRPPSPSPLPCPPQAIVGVAEVDVGYTGACVTRLVAAGHPHAAFQVFVDTVQPMAPSEDVAWAVAVIGGSTHYPHCKCTVAAASLVVQGRGLRPGEGCGGCGR